MLAISLHAIFEGIAMGTLSKASVVWYLCFAIAAHKFIIAFCVGLQVRPIVHSEHFCFQKTVFLKNQIIFHHFLGEKPFFFRGKSSNFLPLYFMLFT